MAEQPITKRLHISGLSKTLTLDLVKKRFEAIGEVVDFTPPGKNALGDDQSFGYLEVKGPQASIKKCVNGLSGATWNYSKIRIGDAKPDYKQRFAKEQEQLKSSIEGVEEPPKKKKKQKKLPKGMGVEASNISTPITISEVKEGQEWGWNLTPAGHLVRPIVLRPDRPIPKAINLKNDPKLSGRKDRKKKDEDGKKEDKDDKKEKEKKEKKATRKRKLDPNAKPPTRANRITLDPTRYGSSHLSGMVLESYNPEVEKLRNEKGVWICEDEEGEGSEKKRIKWVHSNGEEDGKGKSKKKEETFSLKVRPNPKSARSDLFDDLEGSVQGNSEYDFDEDVEMEQEVETKLEEGKEQDSSSNEDESSSSSEDDEGGETVNEEKLEKPRSPQIKTSSAAIPKATSSSKLEIENPSTSNLQPLPFDPDSMSTFSDGYEENVADPAHERGSGPSHDFVSERNRTKNWLSNVFGEGFLEGKHASEVAGNDEADYSMTTTRQELMEDPEEDEEWDTTLQAQEPEIQAQDQVEVAEATREPEVQQREKSREEGMKVTEAPLTAAQARRAALLAPAIQNKGPRSFQPHARFDPGTVDQVDQVEQAEEVGKRDSEMEVDEENVGGSADAETKAVQGNKSQTQMSSLKDMFKPQEEAAGFSLLGGLDLDLDMELDFLADDPSNDDDDEDVLNQASTAQVQSNLTSSFTSTGTPSVYLFPKFDSFGRAKRDPKNFLTILTNPQQGSGTENNSNIHEDRRHLMDHRRKDGNRDRDERVRPINTPKPFCRTEDEDERKERWEKNKKELTAEFKRRHREAVKKKRRKIENGKNIPGR